MINEIKEVVCSAKHCGKPFKEGDEVVVSATMRCTSVQGVNHALGVTGIPRTVEGLYKADYWHAECLG